MSSALREIRTYLQGALTNPRFWTIFVSMVVMFAVVGPFNTFERLPFPTRLAYWATTMIGSWFIAMMSIALVHAAMWQVDWPAFAKLLIGSALSAFPIAVFLNWIIEWFFNVPEPLEYWTQVAYALPICITFGIMVHFALSGSQGDNAEPDTDDSPNLLMERLPHAKRGPVLHMTMQDHYVSVTTNKGTELVLMRMADAVAALAKEDGLQIHRSHWISKSAISDVKRENGQPVVVMNDGKEFPVSRTFVKAAKDAGVV